MTAAINASDSKSLFRYGNPTVDCDGAQMRAQCRQLATVVSISGCVSDANVEGLIERVRHYVLPEKSVILDLSEVPSFAAHCISLIRAVDDMCNAADVEWALVASQPVQRVLRRDDQYTAPLAASVPEALHQFSDVMSQRRQLLPLLGKSA
jgi:anti-anti-sigma regulatory factor